MVEFLKVGLSLYLWSVEVCHSEIAGHMYVCHGLFRGFVLDKARGLWYFICCNFPRCSGISFLNSWFEEYSLRGCWHYLCMLR